MGTEFGGKFEDVWIRWNNEFRGIIGRFVDGGSKESFEEVAWREVRSVWRQETQRHPRLDLIGRLMEKECDGSGMMVHER